LSNRDADAVTRAVREWLKAFDAGEVADQLKALQTTVEPLKGRKGIVNLRRPKCF
jgi:hypothetical protein